MISAKFSVASAYLGPAIVFCASQPPFLAAATVVAPEVLQKRDEAAYAELRENIPTFQHALDTVKLKNSFVGQTTDICWPTTVAISLRPFPKSQPPTPI